MPKIILQNFTSLDSFQKVLEEMLEYYYQTKSGCSTQQSYKGQMILADLETLFQAAKDAGIVGVWRLTKENTDAVSH